MLRDACIWGERDSTRAHAARSVQRRALAPPFFRPAQTIAMPHCSSRRVLERLDLSDDLTSKGGSSASRAALNDRCSLC